MFIKPIILLIVIILLLSFYLVIRLGDGKQKDIDKGQPGKD